MSIRLNPQNSKVIDGKVFITAIKFHSLKANLKKNIVEGSTAQHPKLGLLYQYSGDYTRSNKVAKEDI